VTWDRRLKRTPDGVVWTTSTGDHSFWQRYLAVFDSVVVVSRVEDVQERESSWRPVTGPGASVLGLPNYQGLWGYLKTSARVFGTLSRQVHRTDAVILRLPGHVATSMETVLRIRRQPYGAEVVGDIAAAMAPASIEHPLGAMLRFAAVRTVRRQCRNACAIAYVTEYILQRLYPPSPQAFTTHYSSIELEDERIATEPRIPDGRSLRLISVGSMELKYKRFDVLIDAVEKCLSQGLDLHLTLIGDGNHRRFFEEQAANLGSRVAFLGELPGSEAVRERLLQADLFVLPSVSEGLPRVIIEAMAVGLPCIGTGIGGIPELLPVEDIVPPHDVQALAAKIREVAADPDRLLSMSSRSLAIARRYSNSKLTARRQMLYQQLRDRTQGYLQKT
jgi:glycosyltransferase involved in cell wall biosynthesis